MGEITHRHFWTRARRDLAYQAIALLLLFTAVALIVATASAKLGDLGIETGSEFLTDRAGFSLSETWLPYSPDNSNLWVIIVGIGNTLIVAGIVALLSTILGLFVGIARIGNNPVASGLSRSWVEIARNSPPILLLLFLYSFIGKVLPTANAAQLLPHVLVSQRGFAIPWISFPIAGKWVLLGFILVFAMTVASGKLATHQRKQSGKRPIWALWTPILLAGSAIFALTMTGDGIGVDLPIASGPDIQGGLILSPEFFSLVVGLTFYTTGFVAEIIRTGFLSVPAGQWEASYSLGLSRWRTLRLIVIPQMLRVIIPPMNSQYINIVKNSTLVIAIGYADFMVVMGTVINKTSHAIEGTLIIIATYLLINLTLSAAMNRLNRAVQVIER